MKKFYFILVLVTFSMQSCLKKDYQPAPPQLKIIVKNSHTELVEGATVKLFENEMNLQSETNMVDFGLTDSTGAIVFIELKEVVYFFKIEKGEENNLESNYFFKEPLKMGERKVITTSIY